MKQQDRKTLAVLIIAFIILATAWNLIIPPYENLDEIEHFEVIRYIAVTGHLPAHGTAEAQGYHVRQEASQPPLYHILGAGWVRLWHLPTTPPEATLVPSQVVACGPSDTFYNKATWVHNPYNDGPPWQGPLLTLHMLRGFSTLLQIATLVGAWTLARQLFPTGTVPILVTAIVAFNPQFLLEAAGANNDNLVIPLATWGLVLAVDFWQKSPERYKLLLFGILSGAAALSKLSGLGLLGLGGLVLMVRAWKTKQPFGKLVWWGIMITLPAVLILTPWVTRNLVLYNDPTALAPMLEHVGRRETAIEGWGTLRLMFLSYWGQLPCTFYPRAIYWPYLLLVSGGILGLLAGWKNLDKDQKAGLEIALLWLSVIVIAWIRWENITPATGGRLLFPATAALALLLATGWNGALHSNGALHFLKCVAPKCTVPKCTVPASPPAQTNKGALHFLKCVAPVLLPFWALVTLISGPVAIFSPPPLAPLETTDTPIFTFGEVLGLHDHTARIVEPGMDCVLKGSSYCRPALEVDLEWQSLAPMDKDYVMAIQLASPVPGDTTLRLNYNAWPGHGLLPTTVWPGERLIKDHYLLPLPESSAVTQAWRVQIAFFEAESGERLPVQVKGQPAGNTAHLDTLRVPGITNTCEAMDAIKTVNYGGIIALTHLTTTHRQDTWEITLCWESLATTTEDYTIFVHAYDKDGTLLANGDGPPMANAFPTGLWQPGDKIRDGHTLQIPAGTLPDQVAVGLYHSETIERLPAFQDGARLANDAAVIWHPSK